MKRKRTFDLNFPNLKRLAQEKPVKIMKALRLLWPQIKGALDDGESLGNIQKQVAESGITISYKRLQIYVGRLRREDQLKNPKGQGAAEDVSRESKLATCGPARTTTKPIAFAIPGSLQPMWTDLTCWTCGQDILSCHCRTGDHVC